MLPYDLLTKITALFSLPNLRAASLRFKHGKGGVRPNLDKALDSFLKGVARGSTLAMVDAGLVYWETGKKVLGDLAGQFNLGISYLQEAVKWLYQSANASYARAQYQLGLCLLHGHGVDKNKYEAARWYLKAAEGGYLHAMYIIYLCYSFGEDGGFLVAVIPCKLQSKQICKSVFGNMHYNLPPWSISILPDCKNTIYNTARRVRLCFCFNQLLWARMVCI
ncbi:hypothetical protein UlMin_046049 [Ulmus minor]